MVKKIMKKGVKRYKCEECGLLYKDRAWATKCEEYCKEHKACNIEIIKHSVKE